MNVRKREFTDTAAVTDGEKADMLVQTFVNVHGSINIGDEGQRGRQAEDQLQLDIYQCFNRFTNSLRKAKMFGSGKDHICYIIINHFSESSKDILLELYNEVWDKGILPNIWNEAVLVPKH